MTTTKRKPATRKVSKVYGTVVDSPHGERRVGKLWLDRKACRSWLPFVRAAWHCEARVEWVACLLPPVQEKS